MSYQISWICFWVDEAASRGVEMFLLLQHRRMLSSPNLIFALTNFHTFEQSILLSLSSLLLFIKWCVNETLKCVSLQQSYLFCKRKKFCHNMLFLSLSCATYQWNKWKFFRLCLVWWYFSLTFAAAKLTLSFNTNMLAARNENKNANC